MGSEEVRGHAAWAAFVEGLRVAGERLAADGAPENWQGRNGKSPF